MTHSLDVLRVRREMRLQRIDRALGVVARIIIGLSALWLLVIVGIAANAGRLTP